MFLQSDCFMKFFFDIVIIWKYWNTAFWFYRFIIILLLKAVLWVRKTKMKHCLFYTKKRFCPCWIKHFDNIKGKYFGIFQFVQSFMFGVGPPVQNKTKFQNLWSHCRVETLLFNEFYCDSWSILLMLANQLVLLAEEAQRITGGYTEQLWNMIDTENLHYPVKSSHQKCWL